MTKLYLVAHFTSPNQAAVTAALAFALVTEFDRAAIPAFPLTYKAHEVSSLKSCEMVATF